MKNVISWDEGPSNSIHTHVWDSLYPPTQSDNWCFSVSAPDCSVNFGWFWSDLPTFIDTAQGFGRSAKGPVSNRYPIGPLAWSATPRWNDSKSKALPGGIGSGFGWFWVVRSPFSAWHSSPESGRTVAPPRTEPSWVGSFLASSFAWSSLFAGPVVSPTAAFTQKEIGFSGPFLLPSELRSKPFAARNTSNWVVRVAHTWSWGRGTAPRWFCCFPRFSGSVLWVPSFPSACSRWGLFDCWAASECSKLLHLCSYFSRTAACSPSASARTSAFAAQSAARTLYRVYLSACSSSVYLSAPVGGCLISGLPATVRFSIFRFRFSEPATPRSYFSGSGWRDCPFGPIGVLFVGQP